jgi:hypothetical protein
MKEMLQEELQKQEIARLRLENEQLRQAKLSANNPFGDSTVSDLASSLKLLLNRLGAGESTAVDASQSAAEQNEGSETNRQSSSEDKLRQLYLQLEEDAGEDMEAMLKHAFWAVGHGSGKLDLSSFQEFMGELRETLEFECDEEESIRMFEHVCGRRSASAEIIGAEDLLEAMTAVVTDSHHKDSAGVEKPADEIEQSADEAADVHSPGTSEQFDDSEVEPDADMHQAESSHDSLSDSGASALSSNLSSAPSFTIIPGAHADYVTYSSCYLKASDP